MSNVSIVVNDHGGKQFEVCFENEHLNSTTDSELFFERMQAFLRQEQPHRFIINIAGVTQLSCAYLKVFNDLEKIMREEVHGKFIVCCASNLIHEVLGITRLARKYNYQCCLDDALAL